MPVSLLRVASILIVIVIAQATPNKIWLWLVYSWGLAHYLIAIIYSKRQISALAQQPGIFLAPFSMAVLGAALYLGQFSLLYYFALHHVFNEAYILAPTTPADDTNMRALRGSAVLVHVFLYFFLLRDSAILGVLDISLFSTGSFLPQHFVKLSVSPHSLIIGLLAGLFLSYAAFFYYLNSLRSSLDRMSLIENSAFEILGLGAVVASLFYVRFDFLHIVLYHFVFWTLFPMLNLRFLGIRPLLTYWGLTAACLAGFFVFSPSGISGFRLTTFRAQFFLWSYIHITISFVLSNAHPQWIIDLFRPSIPAGQPAPLNR